MAIPNVYTVLDNSKEIGQEPLIRDCSAIPIGRVRRPRLFWFMAQG